MIRSIAKERTVEGMLTGWRSQQPCRNLQLETSRATLVDSAAFLDHANEPPKAWTLGMVEEFFGDFRSIRRAAHWTNRSYQSSLKLFTATAVPCPWLKPVVRESVQDECA